MIFYAAETIAVKIDKSLVSRLSRPRRGRNRGRDVESSGRALIVDRGGKIFADKSKTNDSSIIIIPRMRAHLCACDTWRKGGRKMEKCGGQWGNLETTVSFHAANN